jgi:hypothetical protein
MVITLGTGVAARAVAIFLGKNDLRVQCTRLSETMCPADHGVKTQQHSHSLPFNTIGMPLVAAGFIDPSQTGGCR